MMKINSKKPQSFTLRKEILIKRFVMKLGLRKSSLMKEGEKIENCGEKLLS
jgi:hypothetical protein